VQLPRSSSRSQPERDAKGFAAWTTRAQPASCRTADAPLELGFARIESVAERRVPRELIAGDRVQLEQPANECPRIVAGEVAALDQGDCMGKIRERQAVRKARAVSALSGVGSSHQLACSTAAQPPAPAQLVGLRHDTETRGSMSDASREASDTSNPNDLRSEAGELAQSGEARERLPLELPHTLARQVELVADRLERPRLALEAEP
jgi:hypothetical protein